MSRPFFTRDGSGLEGSAATRPPGVWPALLALFLCGFRHRPCERARSMNESWIPNVLGIVYSTIASAVEGATVRLLSWRSL